jgi:hypothetical protein
MYRNTSSLLLCMVVSSLLVSCCHSLKFYTVTRTKSRMCSLVSQIRMYDYSSLPFLIKVYGKNNQYMCCAVKVMFNSASCHIKSAVAFCVLFIFKSMQLRWNMRSQSANDELLADLSFDVKCIKFYSRYFKKIIQERDILITQLSKKNHSSQYHNRTSNQSHNR